MWKKGEKIKKMFVRIIVDYMKKCARATVNMVGQSWKESHRHIEMKSLASAARGMGSSSMQTRKVFTWIHTNVHVAAE